MAADYPSTLQAALDYAEFGFAILPVAADCRVPLIEGGCHAATRDADAIRALWEANPEANVAAAPGALTGAFVLDVDAKGDRDGFADLELLQTRHGPLPRTWTATTPSGGQHLWFRRPGDDYRWRQHPQERRFRNAVGVLVDGRKSGLDVRDTGGCAALPPSRKASGVYTWAISPFFCELADAPTRLLGLIDPAPPPLPPAPVIRCDSASRAARYVQTAVNGECGDLARMGPNSGRNLRLFQAAANLGELVGGGLLPRGMAEGALERAAGECGLLREDGAHAVRATIKSGITKGLANPRELRA